MGLQMSCCQKNICSSDVTSTVDYHVQSSTIYMRSEINQWNINLDNNETIEERRDESSDKTASLCRTFIRCFIVGLLSGGIILAVIMTLWLAPSRTRNSFTTSTTTTTTCTTSTITTVTTTTTTRTSSTSKTSTSRTTTTTAVTTTTTTPTPPCSPIDVGSSSIIYNDTSGSVSSYECHAFLWRANMTGSVDLTFQLQNKPTYWLVDDVSVHNGAVEMLINGDFETGSLSPWIRTDPYGPCNGTFGQVKNLSPHTGSYHLVDGSDNCPDLITQAFSATIGQFYTISFWSLAQTNQPGVSVVVTIS